MKTTANANFRIFYKEETLSADENITFSVWKDDGTNLHLSQPATQEIPNSGVYYYDFTTPSTTTYLLILATDGNKPKGTVLQVGSPTTEKSFYLDGNLNEDVSHAYIIFDYLSVELDSGTLDNVAGGFYSVDVGGLVKPFFVSVNQLMGVTE